MDLAIIRDGEYNVFVKGGDLVDYITAKEASELWGISQRRVSALCSDNRIENAEMLGNMWLIPKGACKPIDGRTLRKANPEKVKPIVKWAGGKSQLLDEIQKRYPKELGKRINKYAEPFVGGGAVLLNILSEYELDSVYISDINPELINMYISVRDDATKVIAFLSDYEKEYLPLSNEERKIYYTNKRKYFNQKKKNGELDTEAGALFIFLNRTCFNGLYRVNRKGEFNVPIGAYKKPTICDQKNLLAVSKALKKVKIVCGNYKEAEKFIDKNTFVYFDPPYRPLNATSSFTSYTEADFNDDSQKELAEFAEKLTKKGVKVLLSNSDPKNEDPNDEFFDDLYSSMKVERVSASRMINSNANSRGKISELLIRNF